MKPLIKYTGGKYDEYKYFSKYLPEKINNYYETFFGGGGTFFRLHEEKRINGKSFINDLSTDLMNFYSQICNNDFKKQLNILSSVWNEYIFIKRLNVSHDNLYRFMTDKNFICDYDHIIPVKQYNKLCNNDDYEADISNVGTLVLLESSLNRSKQDKMDKNSTIYSNSNFYLTSFLLSSTTKGFPKNKIASIDFERYTEEELNNFTIENVSKRNLYLIDTYVDWIYDLTFDFNKDDEYEHNN